MNKVIVIKVQNSKVKMINNIFRFALSQSSLPDGGMICSDDAVNVGLCTKPPPRRTGSSRFSRHSRKRDCSWPGKRSSTSQSFLYNVIQQIIIDNRKLIFHKWRTASALVAQLDEIARAPGTVGRSQDALVRVRFPITPAHWKVNLGASFWASIYIKE